MHQRFMLTTIAMFAMGQALHAWWMADLAIRSDLNGVKNYSQYIQVNGPVICTRSFFAWLGLMAWYWHGPDLFTLISKVQPDMLGWLAGNPIPLNPVTGGIFGFFADAFIDKLFGLLSKKIPWLAREVPPNPTAPKT